VSFDIIIATRRLPTRAMVESHLAAVGWRLTLLGDLGPDSGITAETRTRLRRRYMFNMSGPHPAENEDFPAPVQRLIRGSGYLLEMNLPWGLPERDIVRAFAVSEHLAVACDGAVFDPQDDRVVFPDLPDRVARRKPVHTPIRMLEFHWCLPVGENDDGSAFLSVVRDMLPQALPVRFGTYDPPQFKLADSDGEARFLELWANERLSLSWSSKRPSFGGSVSRSPDLPEPPGKKRFVSLRMSLDSGALERDPAMCERAAEFFVATAQRMRAFVGVGYVERGVLVGRRGDVWYGPESESIAYNFGPWWIGVPQIPTWLTWYGEPYRNLVAGSVADLSIEKGDGLLVRIGELPLDTDQARDLMPSLPPELLLSLPPDWRRVIGTVGEDIHRLDRTPAAFIPPLG